MWNVPRAPDQQTAGLRSLAAQGSREQRVAPRESRACSVLCPAQSLGSIGGSKADRELTRPEKSKV